MFPGFTVAELFLQAEGSSSMVPPQRVAEAEDASDAVLIETYPSRNAVPRALWEELLNGAREEVDVLVYVGMFLAENPALLPSLKAKGTAGTRVRLLFGDPTSRKVTRRSLDEGIGKNAITAKIRNALAFFGKISRPGTLLELRGRSDVFSRVRFVFVASSGVVAMALYLVWPRPMQ